jgi:hypothetical protein
MKPGRPVLYHPRQWFDLWEVRYFIVAAHPTGLAALVGLALWAYRREPSGISASGLTGNPRSSDRSHMIAGQRGRSRFATRVGKRNFANPCRRMRATSPTPPIPSRGHDEIRPPSNPPGVLLPPAG